MLVQKTGMMCCSQDKIIVGRRILNQDRAWRLAKKKAIEDSEEIQVERSMKEVLHCIPAMHTRYSSQAGETVHVTSSENSVVHSQDR